MIEGLGRRGKGSRGSGRETEGGRAGNGGFSGGIGVNTLPPWPRPAEALSPDWPLPHGYGRYSAPRRAVSG